MKTCSQCGHDFPNTGFYERHSCCKECSKKERKARYNKDKKKVSIQRRVYYLKNQELLRKKSNDFYHENRLEVITNKRKKYADNRPKYLKLEIEHGARKRIDKILLAALESDFNTKTVIFNDKITLFKGK